MLGHIEINSGTKQNCKLDGLTSINILLGKNGSGKSSVLRECSERFIEGYLIKYITPQRGGTLIFEVSTEQNVRLNADWLDSMRRRNSENNFKNQTIVQFKRLRDALRLAYEKDHEILKSRLKKSGNVSLIDAPELAKPLGSYISKINNLLDQVYIKEDQDHFIIKQKSTDAIVSPDHISSGESEIICLAIECITYVVLSSDRGLLLLLDEPDVHLHPDLQVRFIKFLIELINEFTNTQVIIATHSTAILSALSEYPNSAIAYLEGAQNSTNKSTDIAAREKTIRFNKIISEFNNVLPIFGAHPLTAVYAETPVWLVEGEDDVRIWQQVVRSSNNKLRIYPVECGSVARIKNYERIVRQMLLAIYDDTARGFSLRDGDNINSSNEINDDLPIIRNRLKCYGPENCILSDDILAEYDMIWEKVLQRIKKWLEDNILIQHEKPYIELKKFEESGFDRKNFKIKDSRNVLASFIFTKPWEIAVGQAIATLVQNVGSCNKGEGSLYDFLGEKLVSTLVILKVN